MQTILLRPQGNLDLKGSYRLKQIADKLIYKSPKCYWIIDMALVNKINNFGLTTLIIVRKIAHQRGCKLYLLNLQDEIQLIFQLTGFDREFEILENEESIKALKPKLLLC